MWANPLAGRNSSVDAWIVVNAAAIIAKSRVSPETFKFNRYFKGNRHQNSV